MALAGFETVDLGTKGQHATSRPPQLLIDINVILILSNKNACSNKEEHGTRRVQPTRCKVSQFISVRRSTCFRWFFRPSSGAQNCIYSVRYLSDTNHYLLLARLAWKCILLVVLCKYICDARTHEC